MKLKAKNGNEAVIEKFNAQSSKTAKYAKSVVKKRDNSEMKNAPPGSSAASNADTQSVQNGGINANVTSVGGGNSTSATAEKSGTAGGY